MRKRLGCLTRGGITAAVITLAVLLAAALLRGGALFSPGALNAQAAGEPLGGVRSHAELEQCRACHAAPWSADTMSGRCLACHQEIDAELDDPESLHAALGVERGTTPCYGCHTEHRGQSAALTDVDLDNFEHQALGFSLAGHGEMEDGTAFACADCHEQGLADFDRAVCAECHRRLDAAYMAAHVDAFGSECLACHDGVDTYGAAFDHATVFALEGAHATTACADCHPGARTPADLRAAPGDCFACHEADDAHDGGLGQDCGACHVPAAWEEVDFDHAQTDFPLTGAHIDVDCGECHADGTFTGTPVDCYACHQADDAHDGELGQDCGACHVATAWEEVDFDHGETDFPLTGGHVDVACRDCHQDATFAGTPVECAACHADPLFHTGLFPTACADCHTTAGWTPARFDRPHTFPIAHGESGPSSCRTCHPDTLSAYTCYGCHEHEPAEIAEEHRDEGITDFQDCIRCHPTGQEDEAEGEGGED